jgi:hypothetical protein
MSDVVGVAAALVILSMLGDGGDCESSVPVIQTQNVKKCRVYGL